MANNVFTITKYTGVDPELGSIYSSVNLSSAGTVNSAGPISHGGVTNRGIDTPAKYPNVKLYAAGFDITF